MSVAAGSAAIGSLVEGLAPYTLYMAIGFVIVIAAINLKGVNFDNDKDTLRPDAIAILDEAAATLKRYPGMKVEVAGHTDNRSSDAHNLDLSQRRAKAVMDYFVGKGVEAGRLSAKGYGEAEPIADNGKADGRAQNRRVELRILN